MNTYHHREEGALGNAGLGFRKDLRILILERQFWKFMEFHNLGVYYVPITLQVLSKYVMDG